MLKRGPGAVAGIRRPRDGLRFPAAIEPHDPLQPDVEVPSDRAVLEDPPERAVGELLRLLLGVGNHRDVGIDHRARDGLAAVESRTAHGSFWMELRRSNPGSLLRLRAR